MRLIAQRQVGIDCCLDEQSRHGRLDSKRRAPVENVSGSRISATLSSDDPAFFGSTLLDEFEQAMTLGLTREDVIRLARNSFRMSFASDDQKRGWIEGARFLC